MSISKTKDSLEFKVGKALATRYHIGESVAKPYFYPMLAPGDIPVTRTWPMEKDPQGIDRPRPSEVPRGSSHGDINSRRGSRSKTRRSRGSKDVDFWSETAGHGRDRLRRRRRAEKRQEFTPRVHHEKRMADGRRDQGARRNTKGIEFRDLGLCQALHRRHRSTRSVDLSTNVRRHERGLVRRAG